MTSRTHCVNPYSLCKKEVVECFLSILLHSVVYCEVRHESYEVIIMYRLHKIVGLCVCLLL